MDTRVRGDLIPNENTTDLAEIIDVSVALVDQNNQFGQVKSASLTLAGPLVAAGALVCQNAKPLLEDIPSPVSFDNIESALGYHFRLSLDEVAFIDLPPERFFEEWPSWHKDLFFLAIGESQYVRPGTKDVPRTYGLLLRKMSGGSYTRIGYWDGRYGFIEKHVRTACEFRTETITIL